MPYERKTETINSSVEFRNFLNKFIRTSEIARILSNERIYKEILIDNHVDYLSISESDSSKISYLTPERIKLLASRGECLWTSPSRFCCKPGSFVSKILSGMDPKSIESFSNQYRSLSLEEEFKFEILKGESIRDSYFESKYASQSGSLGISCMKYEKCQRYFSIYEKNKSVSMLCMINKNGLIIGRSILWDFTWNSKDYKIMDRIYTIKDESYSHYFKNWAHDNGYVYKKYQNWANSLQFEGVGSIPELKVGIPLEESIFTFYPYMDTFKWLDTKDNILYNHIPESMSDTSGSSDRYKCLTLPDGYTSGIDYLAFDDIERNWIYKGDSIVVNSLSGYIRTSVHNCCWSEILSSHILSSESIWREDLRDNIYSDLSRMDPDQIKLRLDQMTKSKKSPKYQELWGNSHFNNQRIFDPIEF